MSTDKIQVTQLLSLPLKQEQDVVLSRNHARAIAAGFHLDRQTQTKIATAVSEIARNAFRYAHHATTEFSLETDHLPGVNRPQLLVCTIRDQGPGIDHLEAILDGSYRSTTGMGMGITGAKRLMDSVEITTSPKGTTIKLSQKLRGAPVTDTQLKLISSEISHKPAVKALDELAVQNQEMIQVLDEVSATKEDLFKINQELSETNRGVVALYDELDTVYRVGRVVASKLDLEALLQAISDATTEISGAEIGAFFYKEPQGADVIHQSVSGILCESFQNIHPPDFSHLLSSFESSETAGILRIDDLSETDSITNPLGKDVSLRSYLGIPVTDLNGALLGVLAFGHRAPNVFTERSERILSSVAVQASIGLDNARLYHSVQSASAAKDQFLAILSHELRTPLNPVFAALATLEQYQTLPDDARTDLLVMRRNLELEARLIDDLLDLTRIVKGEVTLQKEVVDLHSIIQSAYEITSTLIKKNQIAVEFHFDAPRFHLVADAARLQQIFWNLINNAVKFTPRQGKIIISTKLADEKHISVSVSDTGRGIEPEDLLKIFQPFEQGDTTVSSQFGGLGLGLAISKSMASAHGGDIRAESRGRGLGATFIVDLPISDSQAPEKKASATHPFSPPDKRLNILLVDDHDDTRLTLQRLLDRRGHKVQVAASCEEAREQVKKNPFDLIISDLGLPDGNGHDLMRELKTSHSFPGIALSGYGMQSDIDRSKAAGFAAHLTKPLNFSLLESTIKQVLVPSANVDV